MESNQGTLSSFSTVQRNCTKLVVIVFLVVMMYEIYIYINVRNEPQPGRSGILERIPGPKPPYLVAQRNRNSTIIKICGPKRSMDNLTRRQSITLFKHMIVDDTLQLIYCYIPKVGCSNWRRVMHVLAGKYKRVEDVDVKELNAKYFDFKFLSDYNPEEIDYRLKNYFKFMFVRHPLNRLFSAWDNKFHNNIPKMHKLFGVLIVEKYRKNPPAHPQGNDVTLVEYFKYLVNTSNTELNEHWVPSFELCQPCYVDYNYIGKFEDMGNEATILLKLLGLSENVTYPAPRHFVVARHMPDGAKINEWHKVSPKLFQKVLKKYELDFSLFGYSMPQNIEEYIKEWIQLKVP